MQGIRSPHSIRRISPPHKTVSMSGRITPGGAINRSTHRMYHNKFFSKKRNIRNTRNTRKNRKNKNTRRRHK